MGAKVKLSEAIQILTDMKDERGDLHLVNEDGDYVSFFNPSSMDDGKSETPVIIVEFFEE